MTGPGGVERGRISIRVVPATQNFGRSLERYLQRIERRLLVRIPAEIDSRSITREVKRVAEVASKSARVRIPVDVERAGLDAVDSLRRSTQTPVRVKVDDRQVRVARGVVDRLAQSIRNVRTIASATVAPALNFAKSVGRIAAVAGAGATALTGAVGLAGGLAAFTAAASAAAGAAPLVLPALAGLAAVSGTLQVALSGVGDALSESIGDAFSQLSPQADRFVRRFAEIVPALAKVRMAVQDAFFEKLADQVRPLAERYLPLLSRRGTQLAGVLGRSLRSAVADLNSTTAANQLDRLLSTTTRSAGRLAPVLAGIPRTLLAVAAAAAPVLERLTSGLADRLSGVLDRAATSAGSGRLVQFIEDGLVVARDLAGVLGSVFRILRGIGDAAQRAFGEGITSPIALVARGLADLVNSAPGQDFLTGVFAAALPVLRELGGLVKDLMPAVGDLVPVAAGLASAFLRGLRPVIPVAERLATALGGALTDIMPSLSRVAVAIGNTLAGALEAIGPSLPGIASGFAAFAEAVGGGLEKFFTALAPVLPQVADAFGELAGALGPAFASAITTMAPKLPALADAFVILVGALANMAPDLFGSLADSFIAVAPSLPGIARDLADIAESLTQLTPAIAPTISAIAGALGLLTQAMNTPAAGGGPLLAFLSGKTGVDFFKAGWGAGFMTTITQITNTLQTLPGIGAAAIGPFLATFDGLADKVGNALSGIGPAVLTALGGVPTLAAGAIGPLPTLVMGRLVPLQANASALWDRVVAGVRTVLSRAPGAAAAAVTSLPGRVIAAIASLPGRLGEQAEQGIFRLRNALEEGPGAAAAALAGVPGAVVEALAGAAIEAAGAGARIVSSIASGMLSRVGDVAGAAARVAGSILLPFPFSPVKTGPLMVLNQQSTNPGAKIVQMVADAMVREGDTARSAAQLVAGVLASELEPGGGSLRQVSRLRAANARSAPADSSIGASPAAGFVNNGTIVAADVEELTRKITRKQQDAAAVHALTALAAVGP